MRIANWDRELGKYLDSAKTGRFRYGFKDCCLFTNGAIKAVTGRDLMASFRYSGWREAARELARLGGFESAVTRTLSEAGFSEIQPLRAQRGDVVIADVPKACAGVVGSDGWFAVFVSPKGYRRIPLSSCRRAWRVE